MPEKIEPKREKTEKENLTEKIGRHLRYLEEKDEKLLWEDGRQTALLSDEMKNTAPGNFGKFQDLKKIIRADHENALQQLKNDEPGKELLEKLNLPGREEEAAIEIVKKYTHLLGKEEIKDKDQNDIEKRISVIKQRIELYRTERESWFNKLKNLRK